MPEDYTGMVRTVQNIARATYESAHPAGVIFGTVIETDPLKIRPEKECGKLEIREDQLILTNAVRDHFVWLKAHDNTQDGDSEGAGYHDQVTTKQNQNHRHEIINVPVLVAPSAGVANGTTETQSQNTDHDHNFHYRGGVFKAEYGLKKDERVVLLQVQGGQHWVVLDRVEAAKGTEGSEDTNEADPYNPDANGDRDGYT